MIRSFQGAGLGRRRNASNTNAHRYWGIDITAYNQVSGNGGFGDLQFYDAAGNLLSFGLIASMSSGHTVGSGEGLDKVCDGRVGVTAGNFHVNDSNPITIWVDFTTPVAVSFMRLVATESAYSAGMPKDYSLVYSDDGTAFTSAANSTNQTSWGHHESRILNNPSVPAAYSGAPARSSTKWRVVPGSYYSDYFSWGQSELEIYASIGGARQVPSSAVAAVTNGGSVNNLFDNNTTTVWWHGTTSPPKWTGYVEYTFASPVTVAQVGMTARNDAGQPSDIGRQMPREFMLQFYDGANWRYADRFYDTNGSYAAKGEQRKFTSNVAQ